MESWKAIGAGSVVQAWLNPGVRVSEYLTRIPEPFHLTPIPVRESDKPWLGKELDRCVVTGAIEPAKCTDFVSNAFVHTQPNGKKRLVINFKFLNTFCKKVAQKYETLKVLRNLAQQGDFAISFDLQDGFHAIPIAEEDRKYLTFELDGKIWQCAALPFGWTLSPWIFNKVMRVVVRFFRSHAGPHLDKKKAVPKKPWNPDEYPSVKDPGNIRCLPYVDDFLFLFRNRELAVWGARFIDLTLQKLGLIRSRKKSVWTPTQRLDHLGLRVDFHEGLYICPPSSVKVIKKQARALLVTATKAAGRVPVRALATLTGTVASVHLACPLARFRTRSLHDYLGCPTDWNGWTKLTRAARTDLRWWEVGFDAGAQQRVIWEKPTQRQLHCDASGTLGWGAVRDLTEPAQGFWRAHQRHHIIAMKELKAVRFAIESFLPELANHIVRLHEDNQTVLKILLSGTSRSPSLMKELRKLFHLCGLHGITLRPEYIRSHLNVLADRLSRLRDQDDWKLNPELFQVACATWKTPTIDRFATANNRQTRRYNSRFWGPDCEARDSFTQRWKGEENWINPPWGLIPRVLAKIRAEGAAATLALPYWTSQHWWPTLVDMADDYIYFPPRRDLFLPGDKGSAVTVGAPKWGIVLARIEARRLH